MSRSAYRSVLLVGLLTVTSCHSVGNDPTATLFRKPKAQYLLLTGRRTLMVHDPISALLGKTYQDSLLLQLPVSATGWIPGRTIPPKPGYYPYSGGIQLQLEQKKVILNLSTYDGPVYYNGEYDLVIH